MAAAADTRVKETRNLPFMPRGRGSRNSSPASGVSCPRRPRALLQVPDSIVIKAGDTCRSREAVDK